jgi:capsular exopolysaccharide synthesis family protein
MGKVYDALRRAEAQRAGGAATARAREPGASPTGSSPVRRGAPWRRWLQRRPPRARAEEAWAANKRRIVLLQPDSFVSEQFRSLRARLDSLGCERPLRCLAVTSALAGEGKTLAALNLALVSAMSVERRVLLVDCDLRRPRVHASLGLTPEAGLVEVLAGQIGLAEAVVGVEAAPLHVLAVRKRPPNPSELLASDGMRRLLEEVARCYDRVVLDTPPALALPDAKIVSDLGDGTLVVVRAGATPEADVAATVDLLGPRRVVGLVLNGSEDTSARYGYGG